MSVTPMGAPPWSVRVATFGRCVIGCRLDQPEPALVLPGTIFQRRDGAIPGNVLKSNRLFVASQCLNSDNIIHLWKELRRQNAILIDNCPLRMRDKSLFGPHSTLARSALPDDVKR